MGKLVVMRTSENGWSRVGATRNSGKTPILVMGLPKGACGNLQPDEKKAFNKALHAQGFKMMHCDDERVSAWAHANGAQIEVEHTGGKCGFFQRIS